MKINISHIGAKVVWLTGLSGSGKSTIAEGFKVFIVNQGRPVYLLDGDVLRKGLNKDLDFDDHGRSENIRRSVEVAKILHDANVTVIASFITPFQKDRDWVRSQFDPDSFIEVHVSTPIEICERRDPKGLYQKARQGLIKKMTGIDSIYEPPMHPDISIDTGEESVQESIFQLINFFTTKYKI